MSAPIELSLVLPCFNEAPHLRASAEAISTALERTGLRYELVFVDDGSVDGTRALLPEVCRLVPHARSVLHERNRGRGAAFKTGFRESTGVVTGYIDVDLEVGVEHVPRMVGAILDGGADVATGLRRYELRQWRALDRVVLSHGYRLVSRAALGSRLKDTETGFKFFRRETTAELVTACDSDGWFFDTEVMVRAERAGLVIRELPVPFVRRSDKESTVRLARDVPRYCVELHRLRRRLGLDVRAWVRSALLGARPRG